METFLSTNEDVTNTLKNSRKTLELRFSEHTEPLILSLTDNLTCESLNSTLASIYDFGPSASFSIERNGSAKISLIDNIKMEDIESGEYVLSVKPSSFDIDKRYDELVDAKQRIPSNLTDKEFYAFVSEQKTYNHYYFAQFYQHFMARAISDIVQSNFSDLAKSMVSYLDEKQQICEDDLVVNALIETTSVLFGDSCLWELNNSPTTLKFWPKFVGFFGGLIVGRKIKFEIIQKAFTPFQSTELVELFIVSLINILKQRVSDSEAFQIVSSLFTDEWIYQSFRNYKDIYDMLITNDFFSILPFVSIRCISHRCVKAQIDPNDACESILQIGNISLLSSKRFTKAIIDPIFEYLYKRILNDDLPYLEMSQEQLDNILKVLQRLTPFLKNLFCKKKISQVYCIERLEKLLVRRCFEPKGLCFILFSFLYEKEIIHFDAFNDYVQNISNESGGKNSVMLEINSFLMTLIPGPFPTVPQETGQ